MKAVPRTISLVDQIFSSITHGIGLVLAVLALTIPLLSDTFTDVRQMIAYVIFASSLVFLYLCSTLYHAFEACRVERVFLSLDHSGIFILIAGTYTPLVLIAEHGLRTWIYLIVVWTIAVIGTTLKAIWPHGKPRFFLGLYLTLGWMSLFIMRDIAIHAPNGTVALLFAGGLAYATGTFFFANKRVPLRHTIWHLFVLAGSALHVAAVVRL